MKNKWISVLILVLLLTNAGSLITLWVLHFQSAPEKEIRMTMVEGADHPVPAGDMLFRRFKFSDNGLDSATTLKSDHFQKTYQIRDSILLAKKDLTSLIFTEKPDWKKIREKTNKIGEFQSRLESLNVDHFNRLWKLTDPEKREDFERFVRLATESMMPGPGEHRVIIREELKGKEPKMLWIEDGKEVEVHERREE